MIVKRTFDVVVSAILFLMIAPIVFALGLAIRLSMGSPVFYRQNRVGLRNAPFAILKLRTMDESRDHTGALLPDEARITRLGLLLRRTSLDELPQLWNVLRGDMSLVGPRPLPVKYLPRYSKKQARRHEVRPGVTGLAQINGRNAITWEKKFALDAWYVDNRNLRLDLAILTKTLWRVMAQRGIRTPEETTEFKGNQSG